MIGVEVMGPVRRWWWDALLGRRRHLQFFVERWPRWAGRLVRARAFAHFLVGNVHATAAMTGLAAAVMFGASSWWLMAAAAVWWLVAEVVLKAVLYVRTSQPAVGVLLWLVGWREGWSLRSVFPAVWAEVAHRTQAVQAEVGSAGGGEPRPPGRLRPVGDHPKLSWLPQVVWPRVSFWCSPPPGRAFAAWEAVLAELAASFPKVDAIVLDYGASAASEGRVTFIFIDRLTETPGPADLAGLEEGFGSEPVEVEVDGRHLEAVPDIDSDSESEVVVVLGEVG